MKTFKKSLVIIIALTLSSNGKAFDFNRGVFIMVKNCIVCGIEFKIKPSHYNKRSRCSKKCLVSKTPIIYCGQCNASFRQRYFGQKFCNKKCYFLNRKINNKGNKNPNWKGGLKTENLKARSGDEYKNWRVSVFLRDKFTCQDCGQIGGNLHAHHIKSFSKYKELRFDINNGKTLCGSCHGTYHKNLNHLTESKDVKSLMIKYGMSDKLVWEGGGC